MAGTCNRVSPPYIHSHCGAIAQLGERQTDNLEGRGSIPLGYSKGRSPGGSSGPFPLPSRTGSVPA